jgi:hypothetical protein
MISKKVISTALLLVLSLAALAGAVTPDQAKDALRKAVTFFHSQVAANGGYLWQYSGDLALRQGEGKASETVVWVQPPGTPTVGEAFLDAYESTGEQIHLSAAIDAAGALLLGQLHSGGWQYHIEFDPAKRRDYSYRCDINGKPQPDPTAPADRAAPAGWYIWKKRKYKANLTTLDDDTTQAALRFLMRMDKALDFKDPRIHEAVQYGLASLLNVQYANGAWSANFDRCQTAPPDPKTYPVLKASYPASWPPKWPKDFSGCYVTNDNLIANMIKTMLFAWEVYSDQRCLDSACKAGDFLIIAQMPDPQPAWGQQYDCNMHPVWDRAFEPPAISAGESQTISQALLMLYTGTGKKKYLDPIPRAVAYLRASQLEPARLARFYELTTNRPLYFTRDKDGRHVMTYENKNLATNYAFIIDSVLDEIEARYRRLNDAPWSPGLAQVSDIEKVSPQLAADAQAIISAMDRRGAWVERGVLAHHKLQPESGVIDCATFAKNIRTLCRFLNSNK